jgi:hypothetical protein
MAKKKISLEKKIDALTSIVAKTFAAVAGDIADAKNDIAGLKREMAT